MSAKTSLLLYFSLLLLVSACRKKLLNELPDSTVVIPSTLDDCYSFLDNENIMDRSPALGELSADDYFFTDAYFARRSILEQNTYLWARDIYSGTRDIYDWNTPYQQILHCNIVLQILAQLSPLERPDDYRTAKATALFKRSFAFFNIAQLFAPPFDSTSAASQPGIPLKLTQDIYEPIVRSTLSQTYNQIINDLQLAAALSVNKVPGTIRNRPCQASVYAMLSRVFISIGKYPQAQLYSDSCLLLYDSLLNYNSDILDGNMPFKVDNRENLYTAKIPSSQYQCIQPLIGSAYIDSLLYHSYANIDLRKSVFFNTTQGLPRRRNFYDGTSATLYTGLATDEVYLNYAECLARSGNKTTAMKILNKLLACRIADTAFIPLQAENAQIALNLILTERRKELVMRGIRWSDIRRLNREGYTITPKRYINNQLYSLLPNSKLYTLPIPTEVIQMSGIAQNER